jgi:hypothetical protein
MMTMNLLRDARHHEMDEMRLAGNDPEETTGLQSITQPSKAGVTQHSI